MFSGTSRWKRWAGLTKAQAGTAGWSQVTIIGNNLLGDRSRVDPVPWTDKDKCFIFDYQRCFFISDSQKFECDESQLLGIEDSQDLGTYNYIDSLCLVKDHGFVAELCVGIIRVLMAA